MIDDILNQVSPAVILHGAALTDVDRCQAQPQEAFITNVSITRAIANWVHAKSPGTHLVYISTDQVYGDCAGPHPEESTGPVNVYGWTKLWAEDLVRALDNFLVLRLNYVGKGTARRAGLAESFVSRFQSGSPITLFQDVTFNPLSGRQAAHIITTLIRSGVRGTFNLGATGEGISKADFGLRLAKYLNLSTTSAHLGNLADVNLKAPRPKDTRMDVRKLASYVQLPNIDDVIKSVSEDFLKLSSTV